MSMLKNVNKNALCIVYFRPEIVKNVLSFFSARVNAIILQLYAKWSYYQGQTYLLKTFVDAINDTIPAIENVIRRKFK